MENSKIEIGKSYFLRNGLKTSEIKRSNNGTNYIFEAKVQEPNKKGESFLCWLGNGKFFGNNTEHKHDIIL